MKKILYMLVGPKGSGKSHIGTLVARRTAIRFLRVEPIWLGLPPGADGWREVERAIDALFEEHDRVMIESLGISEAFGKFHAALAAKYAVKLIRVKAAPDTCLARVKSRDQSVHIAVSDDKVVEYNLVAAGVAYAWDLEIDNDGPAEDADILGAIRALDEAAGRA